MEIADIKKALGLENLGPEDIDKIKFQLQTLNDTIQGGLRSANIAEYRNTYVINAQDSLDATYPMLVHFNIISEMTRIVSIKLSFWFLNFRAYSTGAKSGGGSAPTTSDGGSANPTTSDGGGQTSSSVITPSGGGSVPTSSSKTTPSGGGATTGYKGSASGGGSTSGANNNYTSYEAYPGPGGSKSSQSVKPMYGNTNLCGFDYDASAATKNIQRITHYHTMANHTHTTPNHTHPNHYHTTPDHTHPTHSHTVTIPNHTHPTHAHTVANHTHTVTIANHNHTVTIANHAHDIVYGIHEEENSPTIMPSISRDNGLTYSLPIGSYTKDQKLDITRFIDTAGSKMIKFTSTTRARLSVQIEIKLDIKAR